MNVVIEIINFVYERVHFILFMKVSEVDKKQKKLAKKNLAMSPKMKVSPMMTQNLKNQMNFA